MSIKENKLGMVGLGVMGRNLLLNMADHGFDVVGYDKDKNKVNSLNQESGNLPARGYVSIDEFIQNLGKPRTIMLLVPAGKIVDTVIEELVPHLQADDLIIDGGNSFYEDTERRQEYLQSRNILYLGVGISGGEKGARFGPSIMPGGDKIAYKRVKSLFESIAAKAGVDPCVTYLGPGAAGHYVKMVHNGIEYGLMQLLAESYHIMKEGLRLDDDRIHEVFRQWNEGEARSYLVEITADIFCQPDPKSKDSLIEMILDQAKQKGTGRWTAQEALEEQCPAPTIDMSVAMRYMSAIKEQRIVVAQHLTGPDPLLKDAEKVLSDLSHAFYVGMIITFAQGLALLQQASNKKEYNLDLENVTRIWRNGCIIRCDLLEKLSDILRNQKDIPNLLMDERIAKELNSRQQHLRHIVITATQKGLPIPAFATVLGYLDAMRREWLPANLIQAQRDYFGSHTYERVDEKGTFHTDWQSCKEEF